MLHWFRPSRKRTRSTPQGPARRPRLLLEALEDRLAPAVSVTEFPLSTGPAAPIAIASGPTTGSLGNQVWFTENADNKIGRVFSGGTPNSLVEYTVPTPNSDLRGITLGPDNAFWFTEAGADKIGRIDANGVITEFALTTGSAPLGITTGPDGALWFTESTTDKIGRITTAGAITEFTVPGVGSTPAEITTGPDGRLWFTETGSDEIGAITTAGVVSEFAVPGAGSAPLGITSDPADGALWFTENGSDQIGRITTAGAITEFSSGTVTSPADITLGTDGNLWFGSFATNMVGQITTAGVVTPFTAGSGTNTNPGIASGPDGALYFTENGDDNIGRIPTAGAPVTTLHINTGNATPTGITVGPGNALWFTESDTSKVGRIDPVTNAIAEYQLANPGAAPNQAVLAPDGNLYVTEAGNAEITRITPAGNITPIFTGITGPTFGITVGPDNAVWFTELANSIIGRLDTGSMSVTEFTLAPNSQPTDITAGPNGEQALYFTSGLGQVSRINVNGVVTNTIALPSGQSSDPRGITAGPDGAIWFTEFGADKIGRITPAGVLTETVLTTGAGPRDIAAGIDGALYFTEQGSSQIGRITTGLNLVTEFGGLTAEASPADIVRGPDGAFWFTEANPFPSSGSAINDIGRLLPNDFAVFTTQPPASVPANVPFSVTVQVRDPLGNAVTTAGIPVTLMLASGTGTLTGTTSGTTDASGNVTFAGLRIDQPGAKVLTASGTDVSVSESQSFTVALAQNLAFTTQPPANLAPNSPFSVTVQVQDTNGAPIAQAGLPVTLALAGGSGTLAGTVTGMTNASGQVTFTGLSVTAPGTYTLTASTPDRGSATTTSFTVAFAPADISGTVFEDFNSNGVRDAGEPALAGRTVVLTASDGTTQTATTDGNGTYSFTGLATGTYTVSEQLNFPGVLVTGPAGNSFSVTLQGTDVTGRDFGNLTFSTTLPVNATPNLYAPATTDQQTAFVQGLYHAILGRDADTDGLNAWLNLLKAGATRDQVAGAIYASPEHRTDQIDSYYRTFLGRDADGIGLAFWLSRFTGGQSETQVVEGFLDSPEFLDAHADNTAFVQALYQVVLGRSADALGQGFWVDALNAGVNRSDVVTGFVRSLENETNLVDGVYESYLHRQAGPFGTDFFVGQLFTSTQTPTQVATSILGSPEFFANAK